MISTKHSHPLQRVTLEMSLKPFKSLQPEAIEAVCTEAIQQWLPLIGLAKSCSVLLWTADGSEILLWDGDLQHEIEWARYIGFANETHFDHIKDRHNPTIARFYTDEPVRMTYGHLKYIVETLKRIAAQRFGITMEVGATFDAGPEFAYSDFKYKLHPEINRAELGGQYISLNAQYTVVCSWSKLHADQTAYAAYPNGIPENTPFGEFLGKQCASFLPALGFDYIWFSNGFALSYFPWTYLGANYDGTQLPLAHYPELSRKIMSFWDLFKHECPNYRTEIRGTNFGTGMDLAKDFIPFLELYEKKYVEFPPPNSPWGALNYDFGLEMTGYMSRIAVLPGEIFPYRFYANDPWFWQNPWWDLYDREPHDIYCPLSVARVNRSGELEHPQIIEILTIDTEKGELDANVPLEIIPHIKRAIKDFPDQPGLLTWLYPFHELHEAVAESSSRSQDAFFNDWFVRNAINQGLPLNTVISTEDFFAMSEEAVRKLQDTILFTSAFWLKGEKVRRIAEYVEAGGKVLLYGAVQDPSLLKLLNIKQDQGLEGDFSVALSLPADTIRSLMWQETDEVKRLLRHESHISDGKLHEVIDDPKDAATQVIATVKQADLERIFALTRSQNTWNGGRIGWVRGSLPYKNAGVTNLPVRQDQPWMDTSAIIRYLLADFGYSLLQEKHEEISNSALLFVARHDNGFLFTGCKQDTSVTFRLRFPEGVPLITGQTTIVGQEAASYTLDRTFHDECRVFVSQKENGAVSCKENQPFPTHKKRSVRNLTVTNLREADLTIYPPLEPLQAGIVEVKCQDTFIDLTDQTLSDRILLTNVSGTIEISW